MDGFRVHPNGQPWLATPRPVPDDSPRQERTREPRRPRVLGSPPYRQAYPRHAHQVQPDPLPSKSRAVRRALIGVVLIVAALAASLVKVS